MDVFSNPLFSENSTEDSSFHNQQRPPSPRTSANSQLIKTRDSVATLLDRMGGTKKKNKEANQVKPLETLLEENSHLNDDMAGNINTSQIESESEVAKLKYENSLLSFSNKELQQKVEDTEKEVFTLREFIKDHEKKFEEINNKVSEQDQRNQEINEDLQRLGEDNRRLLELENTLKAEIHEKEGQIEDFLRNLKEKVTLIKDY